MEPSEQEEDGSSQGKVLHHFVSQVTPVTILCLWQRWKVLEWRRSNSRTAVSRCVPLFKSAFGKTEQCSQHSGVRHRACTITVVIPVHKLSALPAWKPNQISGYCCASIKPAQVSHMRILLSNTITMSHCLFKAPWNLNSTKKWIYRLHPVSRTGPIRHRSVFWITVLLPSSEQIAGFCYCAARVCTHLWSNFNPSPQSVDRE